MPTFERRRSQLTHDQLLRGFHSENGHEIAGDILAQKHGALFDRIGQLPVQLAFLIEQFRIDQIPNPVRIQAEIVKIDVQRLPVAKKGKEFNLGEDKLVANVPYFL